ncbi:hypothetical protein D3C86_1539660 [compost metagenome]
MADEGIGHTLPVPGLLVADADDLHAGLDAGLGHDGGRAHLADHRLDAGHPYHEHQPEGEQGEHEVRHGAGRDDGHSRPDALVVEGLCLLPRLEFVDPAVQHLDVTTQRDQGQHILGAVLADAAPDSLAKADGETLNLDTTAAGYPEVTKFMYRHQQPEGNDESAYVPQHAAHQSFTSTSFPKA